MKLLDNAIQFKDSEVDVLLPILRDRLISLEASLSSAKGAAQIADLNRSITVLRLSIDTFKAYGYRS